MSKSLQNDPLIQSQNDTAWPGSKDELWRYGDPEAFKNLLLTGDFALQGQIEVEIIRNELEQMPSSPNQLVFYNGEYQKALSSHTSQVRLKSRDSEEEKSNEARTSVGEKFFTKKIRDLLQSAIKGPSHFIIGGDTHGVVQLTLLNIVDSKTATSQSAKNKAVHSIRFEIKNSIQVDLLIHNLSIRDMDGVSLNSLELNCGANSSVSVVETGEHSRSDHVLNFMDIVLQKDAKVHYVGLYSSGRNLRHEICADLAGAGAELEFSSLSIGGQKNVIDILTRVVHTTGHTKSKQTIKNVVGDLGKVSFTGQLKINQDAQKSDANQYCHNLVLGDSAEANTKPQLEVLADDVKAAHGATVGQLNSDEIFYLQSRAISREDAELILSNSFQNEIIEKIKNESQQQFARALLSGGQH